MDLWPFLMSLMYGPSSLANKSRTKKPSQIATNLFHLYSENFCRLIRSVNCIPCSEQCPGIENQQWWIYGFHWNPFDRLVMFYECLTTQRWSKIKPESVMTWARAMVANRLATSGDQWTEHQVRHNSGTCSLPVRLQCVSTTIPNCNTDSFLNLFDMLVWDDFRWAYVAYVPWMRDVPLSPFFGCGEFVILLGCLQRKRGRWLGDGALFLDFTHTPRQQSVDGCWLQTISTRTQWSSQGESFLAYRLTLWGSKRSVKKVFWCVLWSGVPNGHVNLCLDLPADVAGIEMMHDARL